MISGSVLPPLYSLATPLEKSFKVGKPSILNFWAKFLWIVASTLPRYNLGVSLARA